MKSSNPLFRFNRFELVQSKQVFNRKISIKYFAPSGLEALRAGGPTGWKAKAPPKSNQKSEARNLKQTETLKKKPNPKRNCLEFSVF